MMTIVIYQAENGYVVQYDDRRWIAECKEDIRGIVEDILEELETEEEE